MAIMYMRYSYVHLRCTSKAGVSFFVSPRREEQTMVAMSVLAGHTLCSEGVPGLRVSMYIPSHANITSTVGYV